MVTGIDVSHWQDDKSTPQKMNFAKAVKSGAKFVFIKVSERGYLDRDWEYNWKAARDAGLLRGGYHFLRWDLSGRMQARLFSEVLADDPGELPPVADYEAPNKGSLYPSNALLEQFLMVVEERLGRRPMIYTSPGFWDMHGRNKYTRTFEQKWIYYPLWIAHYFKTYTPGVTKPTIPEPWKSMGKTWTFWQYTSNGDGLAYGAESKSLDMNWFNGSIEDLYKLANGAAPSPAPTPTPTPTPGKKPDIANLKTRVNKTIDDWAKTL